MRHYMICIPRFDDRLVFDRRVFAELAKQDVLFYLDQVLN